MQLVIKRLATSNKIISKSQRFCEENQRRKVNSKLGKKTDYINVIRTIKSNAKLYPNQVLFMLFTSVYYV